MEAMACGTPCVGFEVGGVAEMIDHEATGYVAHPFDTGDFARGLHWVLNEQHRASLSDAAREKVCSLYALPKVAERYVDCYRLARERKDLN
jgi:glycosyltransferase involved in cell wall biosynthesis